MPFGDRDEDGHLNRCGSSCDVLHFAIRIVADLLGFVDNSRNTDSAWVFLIAKSLID